MRGHTLLVDTQHERGFRSHPRGGTAGPSAQGRKMGDRKVWGQATRCVLDTAGWGAASAQGMRGAGGAQSRATCGLARHANSFLGDRRGELAEEVSAEVLRRDSGPSRPDV